MLFENIWKKEMPWCHFTFIVKKPRESLLSIENYNLNHKMRYGKYLLHVIFIFSSWIKCKILQPHWGADCLLNDRCIWVLGRDRDVLMAEHLKSKDRKKIPFSGTKDWPWLENGLSQQDESYARCESPILAHTDQSCIWWIIFCVQTVTAFL